LIDVDVFVIHFVDDSTTNFTIKWDPDNHIMPGDMIKRRGALWRVCWRKFDEDCRMTIGVEEFLDPKKEDQST
jgi:hypothetical protein